MNIYILQEITSCHFLSDHVKTHGSAHKINRGSYISAHVLLNLLNELVKSDKSEASFRNTISVSNSLDPDKPDILPGLIWVQTVCKGYQQTTIGGKELNTHSYVSSRARGLIFGQSLSLLPYF